MIVNGTNISMVRGDSETINVHCTDEQGDVYQFQDGDTVYLTVKTDIYTTEKILQKIVTSFTDGQAKIEILPTDTKDVKFGTYKYDIQLNRHDGRVITLIRPSDFIIEGEITYE